MERRSRSATPWLSTPGPTRAASAEPVKAASPFGEPLVHLGEGPSFLGDPSSFWTRLRLFWETPRPLGRGVVFLGRPLVFLDEAPSFLGDPSSIWGEGSSFLGDPSSFLGDPSPRIPEPRPTAVPALQAQVPFVCTAVWAYRIPVQVPGRGESHLLPATTAFGECADEEGDPLGIATGADSSGARRTSLGAAL